MSNYTFLGNIADWFDHNTNRMIELRDNALHSIDPRGLATRGLSPIALALAGQRLGVHLLQSFVDTLRIGNGVFVQGGAMGIVQDTGRLLNVIGAGRVVGRTIRVLSAVQTLPMECAPVSIFNALQRTNNRIFTSVRDLVTRAGMDYQQIGDLGSLEVDLATMWRLLSERGVQMSSLSIARLTPHAQRWAQLLLWIRNSPRGSFVISLSHNTFGSHTMMAVREASGNVVFVNTTGSSVIQLSNLRLTGFFPSELHTHVFIQDAAVALANPTREVTSISSSAASNLVRLSTLLLEVIPIVVSRQLQTATGDHERTGQTHPPHR